jgi:hypothetical protein
MFWRCGITSGVSFLYAMYSLLYLETSLYSSIATYTDSRSTNIGRTINNIAPDLIIIPTPIKNIVKKR